VTDYCGDCDFAYNLDQAIGALSDIRQLSAEVAAILENEEHDVRRRPGPDTWSPLEYGCHIRDVLLVQRERALAGRRTSGAELTAMGREERVEHDGYNEQNPADVARQVVDSAMLFTNVMSRLTAKDWDRTVVYNYPETYERSLRWLAVHTLHDVRHHLLDIRRQLS
jgi:DinB superfamily